MIDAFRTSHDCTSTDPARRVSALDDAITRATTHERTAAALKKTKTAKLAALDEREGRNPTAETRAERKDLLDALAQIERGVRWGDGIDPDLTPLVSMPGLAATRELLRGLKAERAEWLIRRDRNDDETRLYRLREGMTHRVDGHLMLPGETTRLTWRGVESFGDKFELVEEPAGEEPVEAPELETEAALTTAAGAQVVAHAQPVRPDAQPVEASAPSPSS